MSGNPLETISQAIGPAPWYWKTFPPIISNSGHRFIWRRHATTLSNSPVIALSRASRPNELLLAANTYLRAFLIPPALLGLWFPKNGRIFIYAFDPDRLTGFSLVELPKEFYTSRELSYYTIRKPEFEFVLPIDLSEGVRPLDFPAGARETNESLLVAGWPPRASQDSSIPEDKQPADMIIDLVPAQGLVKVFPQKWFTAPEFDLGYQWITRVARDPTTKRLIGDGIRIGAFELTEDGCHLGRWLEQL